MRDILMTDGVWGTLPSSITSGVTLMGMAIAISTRAYNYDASGTTGWLVISYKYGGKPLWSVGKDCNPQRSRCSRVAVASPLN